MCVLHNLLDHRMIDTVEIFLKKKSFLEKIQLRDFRDPKVILSHIQNQYQDPSQSYIFIYSEISYNLFTLISELL